MMTQTPAAAPRATQGGGQGGAHPTLPQIAPVPPTPPTEGVVVIPDGPGRFGGNADFPDGAIIVTIAFFLTVAFVLVGLPIARAWARRMDRGGTTPPAVPREVAERLQHIEHAVDSIALEVERISEGQRFTTRLLAEKHGDVSRVGGTA